MPQLKLNERITLQKKQVIADEHGEPQEVWADLATVWADVRDVSGLEFFNARQLNAELTTIFTIRWRNDISQLERIKYRGEFYDIAEALERFGRNRFLEIKAAALVASL